MFYTNFAKSKVQWTIRGSRKKVIHMSLDYSDLWRRGTFVEAFVIGERTST